MTVGTTREKIRYLLVEVAADEIADDQEIFTSGLVNSLFAMQLVLFLEQEFQLKVEDEDLDINNFNTLNALVDFVEKKTS